VAVQLSENAAKEVKRVMAERGLPDQIALRVGVAGGGCSGFEYRLGFDEKVDGKKDVIRDLHGIRVAIDKQSILYLDGLEIDYHESLERRGFTFHNPSAAKTCGCGSSFSA
jgi:iron-sulfur cluster assembly protein